ncbi:MAG: sulfite exporter TauE/SafE family protein [Clostridia bacterium]|nr:sulfite exporter TauE/SafE family protein [Clostridia bacterium]
MTDNKTSKLKKGALILIGGAIGGFINGLLGAGGGIILLWVLARLNPEKGGNAVRDNFAAVVLTVLILSCASAVTYSAKNGIDTKSLLTLAVPGMAGGVLGAYLTDRLNTDILKLVFSILIIIAGINMIF